jgi:hypothetical protein
MRQVRSAAVGLVGLGLLFNAFFVACGSEATVDVGDGGARADGTSPLPDGAQADTGLVDPDGALPSDAGRDPDATRACIAKGAACAQSSDCCTASCVAGEAGKVCGDPVNACKLPGTACATGLDCCTGSCASGTCSATVCATDGQRCGSSADCCGLNCDGGVCKSLNPGGKPTSGSPCVTDAECASGWCNAGICANPSFCTVTGDICLTDTQCCGGKCAKTSGAIAGVCQSITASGTNPCKAAGELCGPSGTCTGADCCGRSCAPEPRSGKAVCQPASGCRLTGDLCINDNDCCGAPGAPGAQNNGGQMTNVMCIKAGGATFGLCGNGNACVPPGGLCKPGNATMGGAMACSTSANCCAGNTNNSPTCQIDSNGIPRCTVTGNLDCTMGPPPAGTACASSADCCGNPCVPNPMGGQPAYVCGAPGVCREAGMTCTSNADCCRGLPCTIPSGQTTGKCGFPAAGGDAGADASASDGGTPPPLNCALYGQACRAAADCCSGVPCTNGTCHFP